MIQATVINTSQQAKKHTHFMPVFQCNAEYMIKKPPQNLGLEGRIPRVELCINIYKMSLKDESRMCSYTM